MAEKRPWPLIGITCATYAEGRDWSAYDLYCDHRYALAVEAAGGHPVLLAIAHRKEVMRRYLEKIDGLIIVGGLDIDPRLYGETPRTRTTVAFRKRTDFETWLYRAGEQRKLPIFGICYGMQLINVLEGGTLYQHIYPRRGIPRVNHAGRGDGTHRVRVIPGTRLSRLLGISRATIATEHHQAVRDLAPGWIPTAIADDGIIEAIEKPEAPQILAVQWHPERTPSSAATKRLFRAFTRQCARYQREREG